MQHDSQLKIAANATGASSLPIRWTIRRSIFFIILISAALWAGIVALMVSF